MYYHNFHKINWFFRNSLVKNSKKSQLKKEERFFKIDILFLYIIIAIKSIISSINKTEEL